MTPKQVALVKRTFQLVMPNAERVAEAFYRRLFSLDPTLRPLFRRDIGTQGKKLMAILALVAHDLNRPEQFLAAVRHLGQRHVSYGVQPEDYRQVGQALLWVLAQELGEAFTPEVEEAWTAAYRLLATVMQEAATEVATHRGLSYQPEKTTE